MKIFLWSTLALLAVAYLGLCGYLYWQQERFLFYPTRLDAAYEYPFSGRFDEENLAVEGANLNLVRFQADEPRGVVLYLHGNGDIISFLEPIAAYFVGLGYDVVIPDYRGYGKSTGNIDSEADLHADMAAVYQRLLAEYSEAEITLYGQSIGTGLAVRLAATQSPRRLILESPYLSMVSLVRSHVPLVPGFLLKYQLRSDEWIGQVDSPVYVIHGAQDRLIPIEQGERLYGLVQSEKDFLRLPDAGHSLLLGDERVRAFLEEIL